MEEAKGHGLSMARQRIVAISGVEPAPVGLGSALVGWALVLGVAGLIFWQVVKKEPR